MNNQEFIVQFEDVGFTDLDLSECELTSLEAEGFTEQSINQKSLPDGVLAVVSGYITEDDDQEDVEKKVFACVRLRVLSIDKEAAENFVVPHALLDMVADMMAIDADGQLNLSLEGNWEVTSVDPVCIASEAEDATPEQTVSATSL